MDSNIILVQGENNDSFQGDSLPCDREKTCDLFPISRRYESFFDTIMSRRKHAVARRAEKYYDVMVFCHQIFDIVALNKYTVYNQKGLTLHGCFPFLLLQILKCHILEVASRKRVSIFKTVDYFFVFVFV